MLPWDPLWRLRHVGYPVSPRGYRGLPAFASLSMAGSAGHGLQCGLVDLQQPPALFLVALHAKIEIHRVFPGSGSLQIISFRPHFSRNTLLLMVLTAAALGAAIYWKLDLLETVYLKDQLTTLGWLINGAILVIFALGLLRMITTFFGYMREEAALARFIRNHELAVERIVLGEFVIADEAGQRGFLAHVAEEGGDHAQQPEGEDHQDGSVDQPTQGGELVLEVDRLEQIELPVDGSPQGGCRQYHQQQGVAAEMRTKRDDLQAS